MGEAGIEHGVHRDLVVLDDHRQHAGHGTDEVGEDRRVRVVVVDEHDPGGTGALRRHRHGRQSQPSRSVTSSRSTSEPCWLRIDSAWNCTDR